MNLRLEEELEIECLLSDTAYCDYRIFAKILGDKIDPRCPYRDRLNELYRHYQAQEMLKRAAKEYPDEQ